MPALRDVLYASLYGPWRAVLVLGITEIAAWGALFYPPVLTLPLIAAERGWSMSFAMGGFSLGLLCGGIVARQIGTYVDRYGGHAVMPVGSLLGALGLVALVFSEHWLAYLGVWVVLGVAMAASLYDPAFATLGRIFGAGARAPITALTLAGGFASTVSWPLTHVLIEGFGWRGTYLIYAAVLAVVAAPLHAWALPRTVADPHARLSMSASASAAVLPSSGLAFLLVAAAFAAYAFVPSGLSAHLLAMFGRAGIEPATVVAIGALFGPAQVAARICEFAFGRGLHPVWVARLSLILLTAGFGLIVAAGITTVTAAAFAIMFGAANGLLTIARGTVPLALFGAAGYGRLVGRIAAPYLVMQSVAPLVMAFVVERAADKVALLCAAAFALVALGCFAAIRRP